MMSVISYVVLISFLFRRVCFVYFYSYCLQLYSVNEHLCWRILNEIQWLWLPNELKTDRSDSINETKLKVTITYIIFSPFVLVE